MLPNVPQLGDVHDFNQNFNANEVYRYMICESGGLTIIVDTNILTTVNDQIM